MAKAASAKSRDRNKRRKTERGSSRKKAPVRSLQKQQSKAGKGHAQLAEEKRWILEVATISLLTLATLLLICVLNTQLKIVYPDITLFQKDVLGPVGKLFGTLATGFFGWIALFPTIALYFLAFHCWVLLSEGREFSLKIESKLFFFLGLLGLVASSSVLARVFFGYYAGGSAGRILARPLLLFFNSTGAVIIALALMIVSFSFASQNNTVHLIQGVFDMFKLGGKLVFFSLPRFLYNLVLRSIYTIFCFVDLAVRTVFGFSAWLWATLFVREEEDDYDDDEFLPRPVRRKNMMQDDDDDEDLIEEDEDEEDDSEYTHVVVQRRERDRKASKNLFGKAKELHQRQNEELSAVVGYEPYEAPEMSMLTMGEAAVGAEDDDVLREKSRLIEHKLRDFGIQGRVTHVHPGPVITLFEFEPAPGVKVGRIASLQDDLAMSLRAVSIRIIAPIPQRGTVGIEVPNAHRDLVRLRDCLESEDFVTSARTLSVPIGKDTYGDPVVADIASMPHLLVAGATGTGKSVFINSLLMSLIYRASPAELGLILIDPKILELSVYDGIPHLRVPVVTVPKQAKAVLEWAVQEMERRYRLMHRYGVRSIDGFNDIATGTERSDTGEVIPEDVVSLEDAEVVAEGTVSDAGSEEMAEGLKGVEVIQPLPKIVIVIDELADLMLTVGRDIEELITRLAQKARASGIHLIVATQRPSVDVITGLIKANFPARISFRVSSRIDSRTILDSMGAERLLGKGDMLFMRPGAQSSQRLHGAFVSDSEVHRVVSHVKDKCSPQYDPAIIAACEKALEEDGSNTNSGLTTDEEYDAYYDKAVELVVENGKASTSMIQRAFRIGYNRAARIIETMERDGVIGPMDGARPREVLISAMDEEQ